MNTARCLLLALALAVTQGAGAYAQQAPQYLCVKLPRANLRAGPGTKFRVSWEVHQYMPLVQIGRTGDWLKVRDIDGDIHWVHESVVDARIRCVTVAAPKANIRKGPGGQHERWFTVERYTSFRKTDEQKNWVKMEWEGEELWVYAPLVWPSGDSS
ncbi:MAG: hypothetical protein HY423_11655 [Candidatus Lambdaproteobacteria bacterium]|nr:hypothetical protein [Candidatus Lambdaproteobacteria bacterium]